MKLYKHQQQLVDSNPKMWLMAHECGTGKSITLLALFQKNNYKPLVICPKSIKEQWEEYFKDWKINGTVITKEEFRKAIKLKQYPNADCVAIDESHLGFHNYKSQLHKAAAIYIKEINPKAIFLATATPYTSSIWSVYSAGLLLGRNWKWYEWKLKFFYEVQMGRRSIPMQKDKVDGEPMKEIVSKLVNTLGDVVRLQDCVDMPDDIEQVEFFNIKPDQKKAIKEIDEINHIVRWTKTHCIENGCLKSDGYIEDQYFSSEKLQRIKELAEEHPQICIVARYKIQLKQIEDELKKTKNIYKIDGDCEDKFSTCKRANNDNRCAVLIQAGTSAGYELPRIPIMVFASFDFALFNFIQCKGRIKRINNPKKNVYIYLVNRKGSIDYSIYENVVLKKQDFQLALFRG